MAKKNLYLENKRKKLENVCEITQRWTAQLCLDVMTIVLNDPEVMGKDVFGKQRLRKIWNAFNDEYAMWAVGLSRNTEASYVRKKMDDRLKEIWGNEADGWQERYFCWSDNGI